MLHDEDYDSDTSDEDFVPGGAESEDDPGSEDEVPDDDDDDGDGESKTSSKVKKKKGPKKKKGNPLLAGLGKEEPSPFSHEGEIEEESNKKEKENEGKANDLWADFLADVEDKPSPPPKPKSKSWASLLGNKKATSSSKTVPDKPPPVMAKKPEKKEQSTSSSSTVKITKVFEFAGEEVRVEKEVDANSEEAKVALATPAASESEEGTKGVKRAGGLSSIMGLLDNKKQKLTTLEKTKLDWNSFKVKEGIDEDLESHKKSKHGYLDKQAFLERADHRQFEIERTMRMSKRSNR